MSVDLNRGLSKMVSQQLLPQRLFTIPPHVLNHPEINRYMHENKRYKITIAGRQSFKSEIAKRRMFVDSLTIPNGRFLIGMPVWTQCKKFFWTSPLSIKSMYPKSFIESVSESELVITLKNRTTIELFSADTVERIEGGSANGVILDECGDMDLQRVWERSISPMIMPTHGWVMFLGVPRQTMGIYYKELWTRYHTNPDDEWGTYTWRSSDVLSKDEIARIKTQIDELTFTQEYLGEFVDYGGGLAYHQFSEENIKEQEWINAQPIFLAMDFNRNPFVINVGQVRFDGKIFVHDQIYGRNTNVINMAQQVKDYFKERFGEEDAKRKVFNIYGDYTGTNKHVSARGSAWDEWTSAFRIGGWGMNLRIKPNPPIDRRVGAMNSRLRSADGKRHISINPKCQFLLEDMKMVSMDDLTKDKAKVGDRTHASDGLGYMVNYEYPLNNTVMYNA